MSPWGFPVSISLATGASNVPGFYTVMGSNLDHICTISTLLTELLPKSMPFIFMENQHTRHRDSEKAVHVISFQ